jgi:hypothetical protein
VCGVRIAPVVDTAAAVTLVEERSASHTFVMSGLDPGIYDEPPRQEPYVSQISPTRLMNCRVKPGNDAASVLGISSHYRENLSPPPADGFRMFASGSFEGVI